MDAPLIGITMYGRNADGHVSLPVEYVESVRRAGGIPVLLPPGEPLLLDWLETVDGLILAGGGDIEPALYQGPDHAEIREVDRERDAAEVALAHQAMETELPLLAICRGLQILNVALGGDLHQHLPEAVPSNLEHRTPGEGDRHEPVHNEVTLDPGSRLASVMGTARFRAPCLHHQAVDELGDGLVAVGHAADGVIEALDLPEHPWLLAMQWHPELAAAQQPEHQRVFDALIQTARGEV